MVSHGRGCVKDVGYKTPTALVPSNIDLLEILPPLLWGRADCARWLLGTIVRKSMYGQRDVRGFVRLNATIARKIVGQRTWLPLLSALRGLFETSSYVAGLRCQGYRLSEEVHGEIRRVALVAPGIVDRLEEQRAAFMKEAELRMLPVHHSLRVTQRRHVTIAADVDTELDLLTEPSRCIQKALVKAIRGNQAGFSVSGTGRVFNCITGLKRVLRPHIRLAGESVVGVDIQAAQPSLLGQLFTSNGVKGVTTYNRVAPVFSSGSLLRTGSVARKVAEFGSRLPSLVEGFGLDAREFAEASMTGGFYEFLIDLWDTEGLPYPESCVDRRRWIKQRFLVDVLNYHPSDVPRPMTQLVHDRWPSVLRFIGEANRRLRGTLISSLQRMESFLVIEQVAPRLLAKDIPLISLHDAIYARAKDEFIVRDAFRETFEEQGFHLHLKKETPCALAS